MRGKLIVITGVMALGLSACGAQGSDPVGGSSSSEVIGSAEAAVTEESTSETGESMEATVSTETVSDTTASTTGPSYEDEDAWLPWEDYGECSNTVKEFYNDNEEKTYEIKKGKKLAKNNCKGVFNAGFETITQITRKRIENAIGGYVTDKKIS